MKKNIVILINSLSAVSVSCWDFVEDVQQFHMVIQGIFMEKILSVGNPCKKYP